MYMRPFTTSRMITVRLSPPRLPGGTIEVPVNTAILLIMVMMALSILLIMVMMALSTELNGVHTALGAFVAGMLVGRSPILTENIEGELRGFIIAFFSPVFFAVADLGMDLRTLLDPTLLLFTLAVIGVASIGKFLGALAADFGRNRRSVLAQTRHYGFARSRSSPLPPPMLLPARCRRPDGDLAGADRRRD
jgi:ABC-type branched-subunit amino acid transport system permease subunit